MIDYSQWAFPAENIWIAYSGGLDSTVLLYLIKQLNLPHHIIKAVHINHQLSPHADQWQKHCEKICKDLNIPLKTYTVNINKNVNKKSESPEAAARQARYEAIAPLINKNSCLLTAHHQDDQAETLLLQLLRGAGPKGLAAMPECADFAEGKLYRPLLNCTRAELNQYAQQHNLKYIQDESNFLLNYDRNYLRQAVFPLLKERWPSASKTFSRSAKLCASAQEILTEISLQDLKNLKGSVKNSLSFKKLNQLTKPRQNLVLRAWLEYLNLPSPHYKHFQHLKNYLPLLTYPGVEIRLYRDDLYAQSPLSQHNPNLELNYHYSQYPNFSLPNNLGLIQSELKPGQGININKITTPLIIKFRQYGQRCHPENRQGSHPLKKLFQEWGVPPWQRDRIPLIYNNNELIAVANYCVTQTYQTEFGQDGLVISHF